MVESLGPGALDRVAADTIADGVEKTGQQV
jgi:hypothetical protein